MSENHESANVWPDGAPPVGARAARSRRVAPSGIDRPIELSGDRHPLHYDIAFVRATRVNEAIADGGELTSMLNAMVEEELPGPGSVILHVNWSLRAPVRPGDTITGSVEVVEVHEDRPITRLRTTITRGDGVVAVDGTAVCYTVPAA